jgi:hypothetical protein
MTRAAVALVASIHGTKTVRGQEPLTEHQRHTQRQRTRARGFQPSKHNHERSVSNNKPSRSKRSALLNTA